MATQTGSIDLTASNSVKLAAEAGWQSDLEDYATKAELSVQADRIGMVVANNDASSSLQLTADAMTYIGNNVTIKGTDGTTTAISGGRIQANSLSIGAFDSAAQSATLNSNISIGGRNLLGNTENRSGSAITTNNLATNTFGSIGSYNDPTSAYSIVDYDGSSNSVSATSTGTGNRGAGWFTKAGEIRAGESYTFSCRIKCSIATDIHAHTAWRNGSATAGYTGWTRVGETKAIVANTWTDYSCTFVPSSSAQLKWEFFVAICITSSSSGATYQIAHAKLEKGNVATDWTAAPEDVDAAISDAAKTATSYVTEITGQNGIMVHPSTDQTTGVQITSDVDILRDGTSVINIGTDDAIRIGAANNVQMLIESDGLEIDNEVGDQIFGIESSSSGSTTVTATLVSWSTTASVDTTARTISDSTTAAGEPIVTATVNGTDHTLEPTHVTTTVTVGTGVTVALTSDGVSYVQDLMTEVNEDSVETIFPCELSVEYQRSVTDVAELSFSGRYDLSAVGRAMVLHNDQWSATNQTDIYYVAKNDVTGASVVFGVGTGGQNRGIWDEVRGNWIIHRTENDETVINGPNFSVSASGIARVTSASNASVALRASDYRNNRGIWDYDENKWLLLKGSDKKVTLYGDAIIVSLPSGRNEYSTPAGTVIWSSASGWAMADGVTLNLPRNISTCPSGIVLHWQAYVNDATQNYDHSYTFIPKQHVVASAGAGVLCNMATTSFTYVGTKYIYVYDNRLVGNANNTATGFNSSMNYANNHWVLTQVIAV